MNLKIRAATDASTDSNSVSLEFPSDYQVSALPGTNSTASCPAYGNTMGCTSKASEFTIAVKLFTPTNPNGSTSGYSKFKYLYF